MTEIVTDPVVRFLIGWVLGMAVATILLQVWLR